MDSKEKKNAEKNEKIAETTETVETTETPKKPRLAFTTRFIVDKGTVDPTAINKAYIAVGGKDNLAETKYAIRTVKSVLVELGILKSSNIVSISIQK